MKLIRTMPHEKYSCDKVIEIFLPAFCQRAKWTETQNYTPAAPGEKKLILADDTPVELGWRVRNGTLFSPETPVLEDIKADKLTEIATARFAAETGGLTLPTGVAVDTSRESQALITGAALQATLDSVYTCQWKTAAGFIQLDASTILSIATAVRQHVQACFDQEATLSAQVNAAATVAAVEAVVWQ
jgi:hypothetical protein